MIRFIIGLLIASLPAFPAESMDDLASKLTRVTQAYDDARTEIQRIRGELQACQKTLPKRSCFPLNWWPRSDSKISAQRLEKLQKRLRKLMKRAERLKIESARLSAKLDQTDKKTAVPRLHNGPPGGPSFSRASVTDAEELR